jgi:translation initiation factor 2 beta subunit (eIF-2beta)/eIF-5
VATVEATITEIDEKKRMHARLDRPLCVGIGENVGVLRFHKEAGRELLEGSGEVRGLTAWAEVDAPDGSELAVAADRRIVWEPIDRQDWSSLNATTVGYSDMLGDVMSHVTEIGTSTRLRLVEPVMERIPKHTVWINWTAIMATLDAAAAGDISYKEHFKSYLESELQTTSSLNVQEQLIVRGNWKIENLRSLLRKYVSSFKRCTQCSGYDTGLVKIGKVLKIRCTRCVTDNVIV